MKPCADKKEAIAMLAAGALAASEAAALRGHLRECAGCNAYASQLDAVCARLGEPIPGLTAVEPPPGFHARLKHRIQSERRPPALASLLEALRNLLLAPRYISIAAALLLGGGLTFWIHMDKASSVSRSAQVSQPAAHPRNEIEADPPAGATLMAYQVAFNRSLEEFDALVARNSRRISTPEGMTLRSGQRAGF